MTSRAHLSRSANRRLRRLRRVLAAVAVSGLSACGSATNNTTHDPAVERYIGIRATARELTGTDVISDTPHRQ